MEEKSSIYQQPLPQQPMTMFPTPTEPVYSKDPAHFNAAIVDIKSGALSIVEASNKYNLNKQNLYYRVKQMGIKALKQTRSPRGSGRGKLPPSGRPRGRPKRSSYETPLQPGEFIYNIPRNTP